MVKIAITLFIFLFPLHTVASASDAGPPDESRISSAHADQPLGAANEVFQIQQRQPDPARKGALEKQAVQRELNREFAAIRSEEDLQIYLSSPLGNGGPLVELSDDRLNHFVSGLVFGDRGLGSFEPESLSGLDPVDAYGVLALFGVQDMLILIDFDREISTQGAEILRASYELNGCWGGGFDPFSAKDSVTPSLWCPPDFPDDALEVHVCHPPYGCVYSRSSVCSPSNCNAEPEP